MAVFSLVIAIPIARYPEGLTGESCPEYSFLLNLKATSIGRPSRHAAPLPSHCAPPHSTLKLWITQILWRAARVCYICRPPLWMGRVSGSFFYSHQTLPTLLPPLLPPSSSPPALPWLPVKQHTWQHWQVLEEEKCSVISKVLDKKLLHLYVGPQWTQESSYKIINRGVN